ncbi:MAG: DUF488 domain-containing protein [Candidatus Latescibacteria bacterium]|nr:DUF488 domain-containing protein [Candidatus Latescibacterota bacterium]
MELFTIGHSSHETEKLVDYLKSFHISMVCDVRSQPYSKFNPQYNRESFQKSLEAVGIGYKFLGKELGPRKSDADLFVDGRIKYRLIAKSLEFQQGLEQLFMLMETERIVLMCAEKDPLQCHRTILICRHLRKDIESIHHILEDGSLEAHSETEKRLLRLFGTDPDQLNMFENMDDLVEKAYDRQAEKIAYTVKEAGEYE